MHLSGYNKRIIVVIVGAVESVSLAGINVFAWFTVLKVVLNDCWMMLNNFWMEFFVVLKVLKTCWKVESVERLLKSLLNVI